MTHIDELRDVIHKLHGGKATRRKSIPIKEVFNGETVWNGIVEAFHLEGHPNTDKFYEWLHDTGNPEKLVQHVTAQHIHPALTSAAAVKALIIQEFRNAQPA